MAGCFKRWWGGWGERWQAAANQETESESEKPKKKKPKKKKTAVQAEIQRISFNRIRA